MQKPLLITIPHSGEKVPVETPWLSTLPEPILMFDVDRFVDRLYDPIIRKLGLRSVKTEWHRYACDLNRLPDDVDSDSVDGHLNPPGTFSRGLHWAITTTGERLMPKPIPKELHDTIVKLYFEPFHAQVLLEMQKIKETGAKVLYHIDAHSMPSVGTKEHRDPGEVRADVVVSDCSGQSCSPEFRDLVMKSYEDAGFSVKLNWPYFGGRVTETYGHPDQGVESIQVELKRGLYMDETTKQFRDDLAPGVQAKLGHAISAIHSKL